MGGKNRQMQKIKRMLHQVGGVGAYDFDRFKS